MDNQFKKVCTVCRDGIDGTPVMVIRANGVVSYFHERCLPPKDQWRLRVTKDNSGGPLPM